MNLHLLVAAIVAVAAIGVFVALQSNGIIVANTNAHAYTATFTVLDEQSRVHHFTGRFDGTRTLLEGTIELDKKPYPASILYDGTRTYIIREHQAVYYEEPSRQMYGFVPPQYLNSSGLTYEVVATTGELPSDYIITTAQGTSRVTLTDVRTGANPVTVPEGIQLIPAEGFVKVQ